MINQENNDKKGLLFTIIGFAVAILIVLLMINLTPITEFVMLILSIIAPIALGGAIAYALNPVLKTFEFIVFKRLNNKKLVRILSLFLTYVYAFLIIALIVAVIVPKLAKSILDLGGNYDLYMEKTIESINSIISKLSVNFENLNVEDVKKAAGEIINESGDLIQTILDTIFAYGSALVTTVKNLLLGLFISIYILASKERLYAISTKTARAFMSGKVFNACMRYIRIANSTFGRFFIGKLFDSTIVFIVTLTMLAILGIPHETFIAMIVGVLNIIPFFGIIVAIILSSFIVILAAPGKFLLFLIVMIIIQQIDSNIIAPKILGTSAGISSLGVITAIIIMGSCFGIIGMIIGVPLFAIIIAMVKEFLDKKLAKKHLPTNISNYYSDQAYSEENEEYKSLTKLMLEPVFKKISSLLNMTISRELKKDDITSEDPEDNNDSNSENSNNSDTN